jgi:tetratricopeptide (TPR) repeat protein
MPGKAMSRMPISLDLLRTLSRTDPAVILLFAISKLFAKSKGSKKASRKALWRLACSRQLALAATPAGCRFLADVLQGTAALWEEPAFRLAALIEAHAMTLFSLARFQEALVLFEALMAVAQVQAEPKMVAALSVSRGATLRQLGRLGEALTECQRAIAIFQELVLSRGRADLASDLARAHVGHGNVLSALGRLGEAVAEFQQAIAIFQELVHGQGRAGLAYDLAGAHEGLGNALDEQDRSWEALAEYQRAIAIFEELVHGQGRVELVNGLAAARMNLGLALASLGRLEEAVAEYQRAIAIRTALIHRQGNAELANDLARARKNLGAALAAQGKLDQALEVFQRLDTAHFQGDDLFKFHCTFGSLLWVRGRHDAALEQYSKAREIYRQVRRLAGIDDTSLEYVRERAEFLHECVCLPLARERFAEAYAAVRDGKAGVLNDMRSRRNGEAAREPRAVIEARTHLVRWLREESPGRLPPTEWSVELHRRTETYLRQRHMTQHSRAETPASAAAPGAEPDLEAIQDVLPAHWAVLDFWRTVNEEYTVFLVTRRGLVVERLQFPVKSKRFAAALQGLLCTVANPFNEPYDDALSDLFVYLFAPILPRLREAGVRGLYLVPHGLLHALPLHACRWKDAISGEVKYLGD